MKEKIIKNLPNCCSLLNASCGITAVFIALFYQNQKSIFIACFLILMGGLFDSLDGKIARNFHAESPMGKELDSFADLITFGVAPAAILLVFNNMIHISDVSLYEIIICVIYIVCAIYRLARYNITEYTGYFQGLPTTASGAIIGIYILISNFFFENLLTSYIYTVVSFVLITILGLLMISTIKVKKI